MRSGRVDDRDVVAAAVADVPGVQAQVDELAVGAVEEAVDVLLGVDVAVGVRVVLRTHAVLLEHRLAELVHALGLLAPLLGGQVAVLEHRAGGRVAPHLGDDDDVLTADGGSQLRDVLDLLPDGIPGIVLVQVLEHGARRQLEIARGEFVGQLLRVGRQVAERAELDPLVARGGDLVEEAGVRGLLGSSGNQTPQESGADPTRMVLIVSSAFQLSDGRRKGRWIFFQSA